MAERNDVPQARINAKIEEIKRDYGNGICDLLKELNQTRLKGKGKITPLPIEERNSLCWMLAWKQDRDISFELSIVVNVEDDGRQARVGRVWVHRHASTPLDYDGHTPTTRMRRLTALSIAGIRDAIEAEWS